MTNGCSPVLTYVEGGDLFTSPAQTLVNTVNLVGVMGRGVALRFKQVYPEMFQAYQRACQTGEIAMGKPWIYRTARKQILNFPTKRHWRNPSRYEDIELGLGTFVQQYPTEDIRSVAFPALGCGNGGLSWDEIRPLMERYLSPLPIDVFVYPPHERVGNPEPRVPEDIRRWLRSDPKSLPFTEVWDDIMHTAAQRFSVVDGGYPEYMPGESTRLVQLIDQSRQYVLSALDFSVVWDCLRVQGYLRKDYLHSVMGDTGTIVWELLIAQSYIETLVTYTTREPAPHPTLQLRLPARERPPAPIYALSPQ